MPKSPSLFLVILLLALSPVVARANDSLYDRHSARTPTVEQQAMFGPQSGKLRYDNRMLHAAQIAADRAKRHSTYRCWHYVKTALMAANAVDSYPKTEFAREAGVELQKSYGFKKLKISDPYKAPIGSVIVYGGRGAGHVEIRTAAGFVSDFSSPRPSTRPLLGIFIKPRPV